MGENKNGDNLSMTFVDDERISVDSTYTTNELIMLRLPTNSVLKGNMLKLSSKDALEIIANLAVQVALGA